MPTWKLTLEYRGTQYQGWQEQKEGRTLMGELRRAAGQLFTGNVDIQGSGRTDAGVHALAQVAHLKARGKRPLEAIRDGLNEHLPPDMHVLRVELVPDNFHARHWALMRYYLYQISTRRTAFAKSYVWWVPERLDVQKMVSASRRFLGRHDFHSFTERPQEQGSTQVQVEEVRILSVGDLVLVRIGASHFLWKMVRRVVGVLVGVGSGRLSEEDVERFLTSRSRDVAAFTAPASGLFLERVLYEKDEKPKALRPAFPVETP